MTPLSEDWDYSVFTPRPAKWDGSGPVELSRDGMPDESPFQEVRFTMIYQDGQIECVGIHLVPARDVSGRDMRQFPLASLIEQARQVAALTLVPKRDLKARAQRGRPRHGHSEDFYRDIARLYAIALTANPKAPVAHLTRHLPDRYRDKNGHAPSEATMRRWAREAKKFLPEMSVEPARAQKARRRKGKR